MSMSVAELRVAVKAAVRDLDPDVLEVEVAEDLMGEFAVISRAQLAAVDRP